MKAVSYNTEHLFQTIFSTLSLFSLTFQPRESLHNEYKSYPGGISLFPKGWEQTHTCCFILQTMRWIFYKLWNSAASMKETPKEGWDSALPLSLPWFSACSSKLTSARVRSRTDCGRTYLQEMKGCKLYCAVYLKEQKAKDFCSTFMSSFCVWWWEGEPSNVVPGQKGLMLEDWELGQVTFQIIFDRT